MNYIASTLGWFNALDVWKLATFLLAAYVALTSYWQYRLAREKFKLDLFEKRFAVFAGARVLLTCMVRDAQLADMKTVWEYRAAIADATFLFDDALTEYLEEIYKHGVALHFDGERLKSLPVGEERTRLVNLIEQNIAWSVEQLPELKRRFTPYMKFKTWH